MIYILLFIGFILLIKGADIFVDGASNIAKYFGVPSLIIGLTIVSIGTSAPEAAVSITAALNGSNGIALGNVIGSNIFNTTLVVGFCALVRTIKVKKDTISREFPFLIISSIICAYLVYNGGVVSRFDGLILLIFFVAFMAYIITFALKNRTEVTETTKNIKIFPSIISSLIGVVAIIFGGELVVNSATEIAEIFGLSQTVIGLTVVAIGTSLPELVTSIVAATKGESDIAIGNVIGSNIFNMLFILGSTTVIMPISAPPTAIFDVSIFIVLLIFIYLISKFTGKIKRFPAFLLVLSYFVYTWYILAR